MHAVTITTLLILKAVSCAFAENSDANRPKETDQTANHARDYMDKMTPPPTVRGLPQEFRQSIIPNGRLPLEVDVIDFLQHARDFCARGDTKFNYFGMDVEFARTAPPPFASILECRQLFGNNSARWDDVGHLAGSLLASPMSKTVQRQGRPDHIRAIAGGWVNFEIDGRILYTLSVQPAAETQPKPLPPGRQHINSPSRFQPESRNGCDEKVRAHLTCLRPQINIAVVNDSGPRGDFLDEVIEKSSVLKKCRQRIGGMTFMAAFVGVVAAVGTLFGVVFAAPGVAVTAATAWSIDIAGSLGIIGAGVSPSAGAGLSMRAGGNRDIHNANDNWDMSYSAHTLNRPRKETEPSNCATLFGQMDHSAIKPAVSGSVVEQMFRCCAPDARAAIGSKGEDLFTGAYYKDHLFLAPRPA